MTSISSLLGKMPSLVDYLNSNTTGGSTGITTMNLNGNGTQDLSSLIDSSTAGDTLSLSSAAQQMLAQQQGSDANADGGKAAKEDAASFVVDFFKDSGVDFEKISGEAKQLLQGISDLITGMENVTRDSTVDAMTKGYLQGQRESFTLQGTDQRLSATVQYNNGKPVSLTVTQIQGTTASSALITLGKDEAGKAALNIERVQKQYSRFGGLTSSEPTDPLSLKLYA